MSIEKVLPTSLLLALGLASVRAAIVYDNSNNDLNARLSAESFEIGDEVILGGSDRNLSAFDFQYYGINFSGGEQARVRFYNNNGAAYGGNASYLMPNTVFYDSGLFSVGATTRSVLYFDLANENITLPERFTWSVQFSGITAGEFAGVDLYSAPAVGQNFSDYWHNHPTTGWEPRTNPAVAMNFSARFQAVPEPSFWALSLVGGMCGLFLVRRRSAKS